MKLAKKLLAVALAGVMAVSMLAGCSSSSSDKSQKEYAKALTSAVNSANATAFANDKSNKVSKVTYTHDSSLDSMAVTVYRAIENHSRDTLGSRAAATISDSNGPSLYGGGGSAYGVLELNISDSKDLKNESKLGKYAALVDQAIRTNLLTAQNQSPVGWPVGNNMTYVVKGSDKTAGGSDKPAEVSYGVQFYSANGRYYAIIVVDTVEKNTIPGYTQG